MSYNPGLSAALLLSGILATGAATNPPPASQARLGINLSGCVDWSTEHPFVDVFRLSRPWISQRQGAGWGKGSELERDANGWIKRLAPDCSAETPVFTAGHAPSGEYVCLFEGEGELDFKPNRGVKAHAPGRIVVDLDGAKGGVFVQLKRTDPQNPIRNLRLLMPGGEPTAAQEPFSSAFLQRWRGFRAIRFMDWQETNDSHQREWAERPTLASCNFTGRGVPVEVMVDLCNRLQAEPWFCLPHLASDDYVRQFAALVKARLDPVLRVYVEYSNEVWNSSFGQHRHAEEQGKRLGLGPADRPWEGAAHFYARRSVEVFRLWEEAFGGRERLVRVIAWQAAGGEYWSDKMVLSFENTGRNCDVLAIAPYISVLPGPQSKPSSDEVAGWALEHLLDFTETNALPACVGWMRTQKQVADKHGLKLVCYEAGQHLVGVGGGENHEALTKLMIAANRHPRMGVFYSRYLDAWKSAGGDLCCLFSSVAQPSKWGSWGLLEAADEKNSPKFDAVMNWRTKNEPQK
jgi:hypothetical protein